MNAPKQVAVLFDRGKFVWAYASVDLAKAAFAQRIAYTKVEPKWLEDQPGNIYQVDPECKLGVVTIDVIDVVGA